MNPGKRIALVVVAVPAAVVVAVFVRAMNRERRDHRDWTHGRRR